MENKKIKILAIDDNRDNLISIKALLSEALPQLVVYTEESGQGGIESARNNDPDVILLDIVMPGMDGYEVCKLLKADEQLSETPVIFLTALKGDKQSRILALEAGGDAFLAKPVDISELKAQILAMFKIKQAATYKRNEKLRLEKLVQKRTEKLNEQLQLNLEINNKLSESEKKFRVAMEISPDGFSILHPLPNEKGEIVDFTWVYENPAIARINGTDPEKVKGKRLLELFPTHKSTSVFEAYIHVANSRKPLIIEEVYVGEILTIPTWLRLVIVPMNRDIAVLAQDITESKQTENELKESERKFRNIFDNHAATKLIIDPENGNIMDANNAAGSFYGWSKETLKKMNISQINTLPPEGLKKEIEKARKKRKYNFEFQHRRADGSQVDVEVFSSSIMIENKEYLHSIIHDITEKKKTQEKLKLLNRAVEASSVSVVITDPEGHINYVNPYFTKLTGYSYEEALGKNPRILKSGNQSKEFYKDLWNTILSGKDWTGEFQNRKKNGELYWEEAVISPILNSKGELTNIVAIKDDITEQKRNQEKIIIAKDTYESIFNSVSEAIYILDEKGIFIDANKGAELMYGYTHAELIGKSPADVSAPGMNDLNAVWKIIQKVSATGISQSFEFFGQHKSGVVFPKEVIINRGRYFGKDHIIATARDITEQKRFEDTQKLLLEISSLTIKHFTLTSFLAEVHQKIKQVIRADNFYVALYNETDNTFSFPYHVDDYDKVELNKPYDFSKGLTDYVFQTNQSLIITPKSQLDVEKDGMIKKFGNELSVWLGVPFKINEGSKPNGVIAIQDYQNLASYTETDKSIMEIIAHNTGSFIERVKYLEEMVQAKEKAEESELILKGQKNEIELNNSRLESLLKISQFRTNSIQELLDFALKEAIELTHSKIGYIYFYDESKQQFTLNTWSEGVMKECEVMNPQTVYDLDKTGCWGEAVRQRKPIVINNFHAENPIKKGTPEGHVKLDKFLTIPFFSDNKIVAVAGIANKDDDYNNSDIRQLSLLMDSVWKISEKIKIIKELTVAKEKAEESNRLKSAFLNNMSHEIRTPMNGILGFTNLLLKPNLSDEKKESYIKVLHQSGQRMLNTVNDIIEISKIEAGIINVREEKTDLNESVEELVRFFRPEAEKKGLKLIVDKLLPVTENNITTDRNKFDSILSNLIKNAIKYTDSGTINIGCRTNGSVVEFYIKDTGIGIPKDRQKAIFERFIQSDISDTRSYDGAGLGLAISKSYIEMLGGKIWVESEKGKGSTFFFTISRNMNAIKETATTILAENEEKLLIPKNLGLKVLIAEDDKVSEMLISEEMKKFSKEILKVTTGIEAIETCRKNPDIDLVLMDIQMPEMGGYEATRKIRKFNKKVIIIAQTAFALIGDREKSIESGCNDYIAKPIDENELQGIIQKYFGK